MAATKIISPIVTPALTQTDSSARIPLGTIVHTDAGGVAEYVYAISTLSQYAAVLIFENGTAQMATTALCDDGGAGTKKIGCVPASVASAYYGWAMRQGTFLMNLADDCADNVPLFTTSTAGVLDDATVSNCLVGGVYLQTTASLATALTVYASFPMAVVPYTNPA